MSAATGTKPGETLQQTHRGEVPPGGTHDAVTPNFRFAVCIRWSFVACVIQVLFELSRSES